MARPYWSGSIQISLVSFGVKFFVATEYKSEIRFHQISRSTGERVRHQKVLQSAVDEGALEEGGEAPTVAKDDIVKGYEYAKGQYVTIEPSEIANLRVPSKHSIAIEQFVNESEIDPAYFEKPYFVTPDGDAQMEAFAVVRKAMRAAKKVAIGKIAFGGREHVLAIKSNDDDQHPGLMAYTMRYQQELRNPMEYFGGLSPVEIEEDQLDLAEQLIKRKTGKFDPGKYQDGYEIALKELIDAKVNHEPIPQEAPAPRRAKVVNLMDALRDSLRNNGGNDRATEEEEMRKKASRSEKKADAVKQTSKVLKMPAKKAAPKSAARSGRTHAKSA
ncbi:Ku protein [Terriglobus sp.]|uniref:non-homologous end joining protein Ku n=1 Tax=Terriglobus sp. TaxID=1889013 RepID=UPI003B002E80